MVQVGNGELLNKAQEGDGHAWAELVDRYSQAVWSVTANYGLDDSQRHDVVQTVWLRLFEKAQSIREPDKLVGWLCRVARNESLNVIRRQRGLFSFGDDYDAPAIDDPLIDLVEKADDRTVIASAFLELDQRCRELLTLCIQELTYDEIAHQLGIPIGGIGPTRRRCLDKLRGFPAVARLLPQTPADR